MLTDTHGLMIVIPILNAGVQDRDGASDLLKLTQFRLLWLRNIFAEDGSVEKKLDNAPKVLQRLDVEIIKTI